MNHAFEHVFHIKGFSDSKYFLRVQKLIMSFYLPLRTAFYNALISLIDLQEVSTI